MDRQAELDRWRRKDRADLDAALARIPAGRVEATVRRALELLDLAQAATDGAKRVAPLGPPSRITSTVEWMEDLRQDLGRRTFFEQRVLELRPDLLPDHERIAGDPSWPDVRAGIARTVIGSPRAASAAIAEAVRLDQGA